MAPPSHVPPSPQEIQRKLSTSRPLKPLNLSGPAISGTESDSDSILSPDALSPSHSMAVSSSLLGGSITQPPLSSIAEPGEDSEDEINEVEVGGWKTGDVRKKKNKSVDESVLKAGYLWKKGERRKTWKKRWFVLRSSHLAYYKTEAEYQLLRLLELADVHSCSQISLKKHENTFGLVSPVRTFYLQAGNPVEVQSWVKAIEEARQVLMATSTQSSAVTGQGSPQPPTVSAPIAIPPTRTRSGSTRSMQQSAQLTPSPPRLSHGATSSDSDDASPGVQRTYSSMPLGVSPGGTSMKDPSKNVLAGYLMKCGSKRRTWRKRWFVLTGEKLMYTGSHMDTKPHRQFSFSEILDALEYDLPANRQNPALLPPTAAGMQPAPFVSSSHAFDEGDDAHRAHTFKIATTKRTLLLCAPSEEEEIKWLGAIRALIARKGAEGGTHASPIVSPTSPSITGGGSGLKAKARRLSASGTATTGAESASAGRQ